MKTPGPNPEGEQSPGGNRAWLASGVSATVALGLEGAA